MPMLIRCVASLFLLVSEAVAQTTWIVDAGGAGQFTTIGAAFDAAAPGDTLLVQPGAYQGLYRFPAKGVTILGSAPGVTVVSPIWLQDVPVGQQLMLSGFQVQAATPWVSASLWSVAAVYVRECRNLVLSDLVLTGPDLSSVCFCAGGGGLGLEDCDAVVSQVRATGANGANGGMLGMAGGASCAVARCRVAFSACTFQPGNNGFGQFGSGGGPSGGLYCLYQSVVVVDECTFLFAVGWSGMILTVEQSRVLIASHNGPQQWARLVSLPGSIEFDGPIGACCQGFPITQRLQPGLVGPATVVRGGSLQWTVFGTAGNAFVSAVSLGVQPSTYAPLFDTTLFTAAHPSAVLGVGSIGPTGSASISLAIPNLPALVDVHVYLQTAGWLGQPTLKASGVAVTRIL